MLSNRYIESLISWLFFLLAAIVFYVFLPREFNESSIFYTVFFISVFTLCSLSEKKLSGKLRFTPFFLTFFLVFFVFGFRDGSALDDYSYEEIYNSIRNIGPLKHFLASHLEPGYVYLNAFLGWLVNDYTVIRVIISFIPIVVFFLALRRYAKLISLPYAVLLFLSTLYFQMLAAGLVRMFIAISIVFFAVKDAYEGKTVKYLSLIVLASLFHYSALIMLPLAFCSMNKENLDKNTGKYILMTYIFIPLLFYMALFAIRSFLGERYQGYMEYDTSEVALDAFKAIPFILVYHFAKKEFPEQLRNKLAIFYILLVVSLLISVLTPFLPFGRTVYYANLGMVVVLPAIVKNTRNGIVRIGVSVIIIIYSLLYVYVTQFNNAFHFDNLFPYRNLFFYLN